MLIILGMDNTGKTTLANNLRRELGRGIVRSKGPAKKEEQINRFNQAINITEPIIFERFPLFEELIYGNVLRGNSNFSYDDEYFTKLKSKNPKIIYTRPHQEAIFNFGVREQMEGVISHSKELLMKYDELILKLGSDGWDIRIYNYRINNEQEIIKWIG